LTEIEETKRAIDVGAIVITRYVRRMCARRTA
jgi:hypothetical protein